MSFGVLRQSTPASLSDPSIETMFDHLDVARSVWPRIGWGLFLCVLVASCFVALGFGLTAWTGMVALVILLIAWRAPYLAFYSAIFAAPLIGWMISFFTGRIIVADQVVGGTITLPMSDLIAFVALAAWAFRLLFIWQQRKQADWRPWLPLGTAFGLLFLAHLLSIFSIAQPNPVYVIKYALRPVLFAYVAWVLLPVNFLRSRERLITTLTLITTSGALFALDGFRSLFVFDTSLHTARPLSMFGVFPIGDNHNVLAEWLVFTLPVSLALAELVEDERIKKGLRVVAAFMGMIALLTLARSAWIAVLISTALAIFLNYRQQIREHVRIMTLGGFLLSPLAVYMALFSRSAEVQSSTDARAMLAGIAWNLFKDSPWIGVGAGTFVERVGATWLFTYEFGAPLDSHGIIQKIGAETGLVGLAALIFLAYVLTRWLVQVWRAFKPNSSERRAFAFLIVGVAGAVVYQLFNTTYWSAKLWLPIGIALAAGRILLLRHQTRDPDFLESHTS